MLSQGAHAEESSDPVFEVYSEDHGADDHGPEPGAGPSTGNHAKEDAGAAKEAVPAFADPPLVAIIIDDIGYDPAAVDDLLRLNLDLTFSVLPHAPHRNDLCRRIHAAGREILIHLPMQPVEYPKIKPGPGAILASMSPEDAAEATRSALASVPFAVGVNNHMGSLVTSLPAPLLAVFGVLREEGRFFVDSRTTPRSACHVAADWHEVPMAGRDIFLDHHPRHDAVTRQIQRLILIARHRGMAIGIGHPHEATLVALREARSVLTTEIRLVPASRVVLAGG